MQRMSEYILRKMKDESLERAVVDWRKFQQQMLVLVQFSVSISNRLSHKRKQQNLLCLLSTACYQKLTNFHTISTLLFLTHCRNGVQQLFVESVQALVTVNSTMYTTGWWSGTMVGCGFIIKRWQVQAQPCSVQLREDFE